MYKDASNLIVDLQNHLCAIKLNFQVLLSLSSADISKITAYAKKSGLQCIADIKLNDIKNTNIATAKVLWACGFDALIANPIMGRHALLELVKSAHTGGHGIISLCHMSSPEGADSYEIITEGQPLYKKFLRWGMDAGVDGFVIGATFPDIIDACHRDIKDSADIVSPGVGTQGGRAQDAFSNGTDYIIVGRSLLNSSDPAETATSMLT